MTLAYLTAQPTGNSGRLLWLTVILALVAAVLLLVAIFKPFRLAAAAPVLVAASIACLGLAFLVH